MINGLQIEYTRPTAQQPAGTKASGHVRCGLTIGSTPFAVHIPLGASREYQLVVGGDQGIVCALSKLDAANLDGFVAYLANRSDQSLKLNELMDEFDWLPAVSITPKTLLYASFRPPLSRKKSVKPAKSGTLLAAEIATSGLQLNKLPLVKDLVPADKPMGIKSFGLLYASTPLTKVQLEGINRKADDSIRNPLLQAGSILEAGLSQGLTTIIHCALADTHYPMTFAVTDNRKSSKASSKPAKASRASKGPRQAIQPVRKSVGLITIESIAVKMHDGKLRLQVDGSMQMNGFNLAFMDLAIEVGLKDLMQADISGISFDLAGMHLSYNKKAMAISGTLLRSQTADGRSEYAGQLLFKKGHLTLTGLGMYSKLPSGDASAFAYAALLYPLGGDPAFFIKGVALGMGYNRGVKVPPIHLVNKFLLVTALQQTPPVKAGKKGLAGAGESVAEIKQKFAILSKYLPEMQGQYMIAMGMAVSTYEQLYSIAVLMVGFGDAGVSASVVCLSNMQLPPKITGSPPMVRVELAFTIEVNFKTGLFRLEAQLTENSFILCPPCRLTGGFAFYTWFSGRHAGDFVITLGGYHPTRFKKPAHYPTVPRLSFNLDLGHTRYKGVMYAALTPVAIMGGGYFQGIYGRSIVEAWFTVHLNLILSWLPFFYEGKLSLEFGIKVDLWLWSWRGTVGGNLHVWGPEFAGKCYVDFGVATISLEFGASDKPLKIQPVSWHEFKKTYLPKKDDDFCKLNISEGLIAERQDWFLVEPDQFALNIESQLPLNQAILDSVQDKPQHVPGNPFAVAPMGGKKVKDWNLDIKVLKAPEGMQFKAAGVNKPMPLALWGDNIRPDLTQDKRTKDLLSQVEITASLGRPPGFTEPVDADEFKFQDVVENDPYWQWGTWRTTSVGDSTATGDKARQQKIQTSLEGSDQNARRQSIRDYFGCQDDTLSLDHMANDIGSVFIGVPNIIQGEAA